MNSPNKKHIQNYLATCTPFQRKVLRAVLLIPKGQVRSYQWIAKKTGRPRSARSVGNVLNKNKLTRIIPCHRVISSDGSIGGYSRGIKKKIALLKKEGMEPHGQARGSCLCRPMGGILSKNPAQGRGLRRRIMTAVS